MSSEAFRPPKGPPPSHKSQYSAPSAPPPGYSSAPGGIPPQPLQHDWQNAVPDNSLLPPPPSLGFQASPSNNSTEEAVRAKNWCLNFPLSTPRAISDSALQRLDRGEISLIRPADFKGSVKNLRPGIVHAKADPSSKDSCLISDLPLYVVDAHSPFHISGKSKTIYFEVRVHGRPGNSINVALGFVAQPYPAFRLPGWNRGSLGIHGDDGHKYVNDMWGGHEFTAPFQGGQTLGIGMTFALRDGGKGSTTMPTASDLAGSRTLSNKPIGVEVFLTRNGKLDGGWNLHEEADAVEDLPVTGLEGGHDLFAAVGSFEAVDFEVLFKRQQWLFRPPL